MDKSMQELIESVTQRVLSELMDRENTQNSCGSTRALVIGPVAAVPEFLAKDTQLCSLEDRSCSPETCSKVVITSLTITQLADIAAGRASSPEACAVCRALLNGVEVYMLDSAPEHRKYAGKCSEGFYRMLEGYVDALKSFGVKMTSGTMCHGDEPKQSGCCRAAEESEKLCSKLITEKDALRLASGKKTLKAAPGVIITPSAKDVFLHAGVTVLIEGEK